MPVSNTSTTSVKVATVPHRGDIKGAITIYNAMGELQGVLNAAEITAFRTALATMTLLVRWKAPPSPTLVVFGAGKQAEWHIRLALLLVSGIKGVTLINRSRQRLEQFEKATISELKSSYSGVRFESISPEANENYQAQMSQHLAEADIICGCTPSTEPLFTAQDLKASSSRPKFLALIGSYKPEMQEVDTDTIRLGGKIYVDSKEACAEEAGELIRAKLGPDDLVEVGELYASDGTERVGLEDGKKLTLFKCVGMGLMDLLIAQALLDIAEDQKVGTVLKDF
jgi:ornithine cyclodeaminase